VGGRAAEIAFLVRERHIAGHAGAEVVRLLDDEVVLVVVGGTK
jgi:hypothetical protein